MLPIYHPAAAMYDRSKRDDLFADFALLKQLLAEGARAGRVVSVAIQTSSTEVTQACGAALAPLLTAGDVLALSGDLGAGKTQLTKGIAAGLGVVEPVTSPTFNILLVHEGRIPLYHFDLYRLERAEQLEDIDYWATLEADGVSVVEWGDRFAESVPDDALIVRILITGDDSRAIALDPRGPRAHELARDWAHAASEVDGATVADVPPSAEGPAS